MMKFNTSTFLWRVLRDLGDEAGSVKDESDKEERGGLGRGRKRG